MGTLILPTKLSIDPSSSSAAIEWLHWKKTFTNFFHKFLPEGTDKDKLGVLASYVTPHVYEYFRSCQTYLEAEEILERLYLKKNKSLARHLLRTEKQKSNQSLGDFLKTLKRLAMNCDFKSVSLVDFMVKGAFIDGLASSDLREWLLDGETLTLIETFNRAIELENTKLSNRSFEASTSVKAAEKAMSSLELKDQAEPAAASMGVVCRDGKPRKPKKRRDRSKKCFKCGKSGHIRRVCNFQEKSTKEQ